MKKALTPNGFQYATASLQAGLWLIMWADGSTSDGYTELPTETWSGKPLTWEDIEYVDVELTIPLPHNGGEWRISRKIIGPRGGIRWETLISQAACGGIYRTQLQKGNYKETYWSNRMPHKREFTV